MSNLNLHFGFVFGDTHSVNVHLSTGFENVTDLVLIV